MNVSTRPAVACTPGVRAAAATISSGTPEPAAVTSRSLAPATVCTICRNEARTDSLTSATPITVLTPSETPTTVSAVRSRCSVQCGHVTARRRCARSRDRLLLAEVAFLTRIPLVGVCELVPRERWPQRVGERELCTRGLEREEAAQPPVAASSD